MFSETRRVALIESSLMGRSAVAVVVVVVLLPTAVGQLTGLVQGSQTLDKLGVTHLATVWAIGMIIGSTAMAASYLARRPDDTRVLEILADTLIAIGAAVHLIAVLRDIGYSGASWTCGMDAALVLNCGGRAVFLARQIFWVAHRVTE